MNETIALLIAIVIATILAIAYLTAFFSIVGVYFAGWIEGGRQVAATSPARAFAIGLINLLFFGVLGLACLAWADSSGMQLLAVPGLLIALVLVIALCLGLAVVVAQVGERLFPNALGFRRTLLGMSVTGVACALPFVGWFLLFPFVASLGMGALILHLTHASRQRGK